MHHVSPDLHRYSLFKILFLLSISVQVHQGEPLIKLHSLRRAAAAGWTERLGNLHREMRTFETLNNSQMWFLHVQAAQNLLEWVCGVLAYASAQLGWLVLTVRVV